MLHGPRPNFFFFYLELNLTFKVIILNTVMNNVLQYFVATFGTLLSLTFHLLLIYNCFILPILLFYHSAMIFGNTNRIYYIYNEKHFS